MLQLFYIQIIFIPKKTKQLEVAQYFIPKDIYKYLLGLTLQSNGTQLEDLQMLDFYLYCA